MPSRQIYIFFQDVKIELIDRPNNRWRHECSNPSKELQDPASRVDFRHAKELQRSQGEGRNVTGH